MKKKNSRVIILFIISSFLIFSTAIAQEKPTAKVTVEQNTNRPGKDYKSVVLNDADPNQCVQLCENDPKCKAYTYVKPGVQGPKAVCWLKNEIPNAVPSNDCISGIRIQLQNQVKAVKKVDMSTNPIVGRRGQIEALPTPVPWPKPDLPTSRFEIMQAALAIPQIKNQLAQIAKSRGTNLKAINTITLSGNPAFNQIYTGDGSDNKEKEAPGVFSSPSEVDWSGGIQLSPKSLKSNARFWEGKEKVPVARIGIDGISISWHYGLDDVNKKNSVLVGQGIISTQLYLPNNLGEPYIVTLELKPTTISKLSSTLLLDVFPQTGYISDSFELIQSSDKTKYIGVVKLGGVSSVHIWLEQGESAFFSGITFTRY